MSDSEYSDVDPLTDDDVDPLTKDEIDNGNRQSDGSDSSVDSSTSDGGDDSGELDHHRPKVGNSNIDGPSPALQNDTNTNTEDKGNLCWGDGGDQNKSKCNTIKFPGACGQDGDDTLTDLVEVQNLGRKPKPGSVHVEGLNEDVGYSSDEEDYEYPEPAKPPSLMVLVPAGGDEATLMQEKRDELRIYREVNMWQFIEGWDFGSRLGRAKKAQDSYDSSTVSKNPAAKSECSQVTLNTFNVMSVRDESPKEGLAQKDWLTESTICSIDRLAGTMTMTGTRYTPNMELSAILGERAQEVLNKRVLPGMKGTIADNCESSNVDDARLNSAWDMELQYAGMVRLRSLTTRRIDPKVDGDVLTSESGKKYTPAHCLPKYTPSEQATVRRLREESSLTFTSTLTLQGKFGDASGADIIVVCTLRYYKDKRSFAFTMASDQVSATPGRMENR